MELKGIDISSWQRGIGTASLKTVDFAIFKISEGQTWADPCFDDFYDAASSAGLPVGAYVFSHAVTEDAARAEARKAIQLLQGRKLAIGLFIDVEDGSQLAMRDSELTAVVKAFCDEAKAAGYRAGAYGSAGQLWAKVGAKYLGDDVLVWVASWSLQPRIACDVWQYTDHATVNGYIGPVDGDKAMSGRFAALIEGKQPDEPQPSGDPTETPTGVEENAAFFSLNSVPVLRKGDTGDAVLSMQGELLSLGYSCGGKRKWCGHEVADGIFGNVTEESVRSFQRSRNLPDNGIVGPKTRAALLGI